MEEQKSNTAEAKFHRAIKQHLNQRQQGLVMCHFREAMAYVQSTATKGSGDASKEPA